MLGNKKSTFITKGECKMKEYKYDKLKGRILEKFGTQESFAKAIGVSRVTVNSKINNNVQFTQSDVERWT